MATARRPVDAQPSSTRGRPLDPALDAVIMRAALDGLAKVGYDALSMADIAHGARVGKGAIYRRWSSKAQLVVDAMVRGRESVAPYVPPDTGTLRGDLEIMVAQLPDIDEAARAQIAVLLSIAHAAMRDPALREALTESGFEQPRHAMLQVLQRAASRGEIPDRVEIEIIPDVILGLNLLRMVQGLPPDRAYLRHVLHSVVFPILAVSPSDD